MIEGTKEDKPILFINYTPTNQQVANYITKAVPKPTFEFCCEAIGLINVTSNRNNHSLIVPNLLIKPTLLTITINIYITLSHGISTIKINSSQSVQKLPAIRAFKISSSSRNKNKRTATSNDDKRSHQHHKLLTIRNTKFINSKITSQIKENQSWPQSKTDTVLLLQHPLPHQYPYLFELTD